MKNLENIGLNIFASIKMSLLSSELKEDFKKSNIDYNDDDTLCLIGQGGCEMWNHLDFAVTDPIDHLVIEQINALDSEARILYPDNVLIIPLQKLGRLMNISRPSPMGIDISDQYGLWFAFRGVFITQKLFEAKPLMPFASACESCIEKPCISSCPASAVDPTGPFKLKNCLDFRLSTDSVCLTHCQARVACPYKKEHQYTSDQISYHMLNSINQIKF